MAAGPLSDPDYEALSLDSPLQPLPQLLRAGWEGAPEPWGLPAETSEVPPAERGAHSQVAGGSPAVRCLVAGFPQPPW